MASRPHVRGVARGTVIEYDGWQWGVVTEVAEGKDPTKVGFVLVDELRDDVVRALESARGCWGHYEAVKKYRWSDFEYWTTAKYILNDDVWTVLGPVHPETRDDKTEVSASAE